MVVKDDWVRAAITDDTVVVELLVRLKQARASAPIKTVAAPVRAAVAELPPPRWGIRQPRTRLAFRCDTASPVKGGDSRRNSPTTPLSWSAGTASSSGTADGYEESDLPACGSSRSKGIASNDSTSSLNKKLKRKKTFAELKEEENLLLKERIHLNKELATLNATFEDEKARNDSLKRMKLDFNTHTLKNVAGATSEQLHKATHGPHGHFDRYPLKNESTKLPTQVGPHNYAPSGVSQEPEPVEKRDASFVLPDLNLMPSEDDFCS
ncbi:hypothetical protein CDL15_Pgr015789 [Punica granatum]|uniref:BZIP domain-containing protein n=1 Tax=Punica granatum TaxID=22663 RepID=A0A218XP66_PUNGR|nr:hypothetical protein CDL15_Pgr015789 [Punica granatum]